MKSVSLLSVCVVAMTALTFDSPASAGQRPSLATLRVVVHDPSGAVIPGAVVHVAGSQGHATTGPAASSDGQGVAVLTGLEPGHYTVDVSFPGFETRTLTDIRLRAGETRRDVTLAIQKLDQSVSVGRDPAVSASDPNNDRFNTVLSKDQIDALPDDPDEMESVLKEMAGPGATLRVDGFRGGRLPPKSQIRSIRFSRDMDRKPRIRRATTVRLPRRLFSLPEDAPASPTTRDVGQRRPLLRWP